MSDKEVQILRGVEPVLKRLRHAIAPSTPVKPNYGFPVSLELSDVTMLLHAFDMLFGVYTNATNKTSDPPGC